MWESVYNQLIINILKIFRLMFITDWFSTILNLASLQPKVRQTGASERICVEGGGHILCEREKKNVL